MKDEILARYYVGLFIVCFVTLLIFVGLLKSILYAVIITIAKYLFDKYLMTSLNPYIDKFLEWVKNKINTTPTNPS